MIKSIKELDKEIESKINREKWQKWKFSDLVENINEKVVPKNSELEHYIGLEHLDSGSLHINRFGETSSLIGEKLKAYKGDIIFAKRNAYLKRVAVTEFDAVASAHSLVLRAKQKNVVPEFLNYFLMSDTFWNKAIEISVGSLSPTINWSTLAKQEFLISPSDEQQSIASLLKQIDVLVEEHQKLKDSLHKFKASLLTSIFNKDKCQRLKVSSISHNLDNRRVPISQVDRVSGEYPYFGASGIVDYVEGFIFDEPILLISEDGENLISRKLPIAYEVDIKCWVNNHSHVLRVKDGIRLLLAEYFNFHDLKEIITGGTRPKITKGMLSDLYVYLPEDNQIPIFNNQLIKLNKAIIESDSNLVALKNLYLKLVNKIF